MDLQSLIVGTILHIFLVLISHFPGEQFMYIGKW